MLLYLPPMDAHGPRVKNGRALAGHGAESVRDAIASAIATLPEQLRRSLSLLLRTTQPVAGPVSIRSCACWDISVP
jgi:hypothetical protein